MGGALGSSETRALKSLAVHLARGRLRRAGSCLQSRVSHQLGARQHPTDGPSCCKRARKHVASDYTLPLYNVRTQVSGSCVRGPRFSGCVVHHKQLLCKLQ